MTATGPAKLRDVQQLLKKLTDDLETPSLSQSDRDTYLENLKIYGRDPTNAGPIFTPEGIKTLARHAFESSSRSTARGGLRVLANSMLLKPATRQIVVDLSYLPQASAQLKTEGPQSWDDSFLLSRILLLATYAPDSHLSDLVGSHGLAEGIIANLAKHTEVMSKPSHNPKANPMEEMALNETLRLLFNVTHHCPEHKVLFTPAIPLIIALFWKQDIVPSKPLDPPFNSLVHSLMNLDLEDEKIQSSLCPEATDSQPSRVASRFVQLLDLALKTDDAAGLDQAVTPLIGVLTALVGNCTEEVKKYLQATLLPTEAEREEALGRGGSLPARLLRTSNDPMTPQLNEAVSHLLFTLSDKDPSKFTENVGFGYASGFLARNNIAVPPNVGSTANSSTSRPVNPVTGQFIDSERFADVPEMTEDEKIREAERLFVLFERLRNTGIVDIQNPVEEAMRSGRFEEMDKNRVTEVDSDDEEKPKA
ncbi:guanine nucleotide exchange factor [Plectosphaerella cucumerina]|uniref:Guanine nucleotide exchange factor n=1 Tax=Plectosphaerella cucumerina TaxID=40658 RepID=A0A8K0X8W0_9PEZI|nr:guanine nucleotide exchange factor [Plectosphaerella cucumerina]